MSSFIINEWQYLLLYALLFAYLNISINKAYGVLAHIFNVTQLREAGNFAAWIWESLLMMFVCIHLYVSVYI